MVSGAVIGGLVATEGLVPHFFQELLGISGNWTLLVGGLILIVTLIQNPEGVAGTTYRKRQAAKRAAAAGSGQRAGAVPRQRRVDSDGHRTMSTVLSTRNVSVSFGGVHAVIDVDLDVEPGQLVGLIGPNGAGKTTFIDAVTGFVPHRGIGRTGWRRHQRICRRTSAPATVSPARGNRSSCSTICRYARTSPSPRTNRRC